MQARSMQMGENVEIERLQGGRYLAASILGAGGFGITYRCNEEVKTELSKWTDMTAVTSLGASDRVYIVGMEQDGTLREYQQYYGNSIPEEMHDLKWVQTMNINGHVNLVAGTKDGVLLTYGTEPFRMDSLAELYDSGSAPSSAPAGIVGMDSLLLEDGSVYYCGLVNGSGDCYIGEDVVQAVEVAESVQGDGDDKAPESGTMVMQEQDTSELGLQIVWPRPETLMAAGESHILSLREDGTVLAAGSNTVAIRV